MFWNLFFYGRNHIFASTSQLDITVMIVPISASATKVLVDAREDLIVKNDKTTIALTRNDSKQDAFSKVFVKNNCGRTIYVAILFLGGKDEPEHWQTRGWLSLDTGQTKHIADTHNRYIYLYAEIRLKDKIYWVGENFDWYEGKRFCFFIADFGNDPEDFTQSFSCE